jgi:hypothetical protein
MTSCATRAWTAALGAASLLACGGPPEDPRFEPCQEADEPYVHLQGSGDLEDLDLRGSAAAATIIRTGDFLRSARITDPGAFEVEVRFAAGDQMELEPGFYSTDDGSLQQITVQVFVEDRHFEGDGHFELGDERPEWLGAFSLREPREGFAAAAVQRNGSLDGCLVVRSPDARSRSLFPEG